MRSPQIRWRKLVPITSGASASLKQVAPSGGGAPLAPSAAASLDFEVSSSSQQVAAPLAAAVGAPNRQQQPAQLPQQREFRIITSNSHIQILENGSMIIKDVDLGDASRYSCQASNGVNPSLSEVIDLFVLSK